MKCRQRRHCRRLAIGKWSKNPKHKNNNLLNLCPLAVTSLHSSVLLGQTASANERRYDDRARWRRQGRRIVWRYADLTYCYNLAIFMCFYLFFQFNVQYLTHSPSVSICNLASLCIGCWGEPNVHIILISCARYSIFFLVSIAMSQ